tara:strand:- start:1375 stop:2448 length:1074 start_codon:yes stop_codon:yes gene_type:complete
VKTLDRYITVNLLKGFVVVMLLLLAIFTFLDFVEELDDISQGKYEIADAFVYVMLTAPERALTLVPVAALLGCLLGFGSLDHHHELVAMRTIGVSAQRIGWSALKFSIMLIVVLVVAAEFVVPVLAQRAWNERTLAISGDVLLRTENGNSFWFRDGHRFISIGDMLYGRIPTNIDIYEFSDDGELTKFTHAAEAEIAGNNAWLLKDVSEKQLQGWKVTTRQHPTLYWTSFLSPQQGAVMELKAESLAPTDLYVYARDLRARGQSADRYELAMWRKANIPLTTAAMVMIAIPFVFGAFEMSTTGQRVLAGSGVGIAFYLIDQILAQAGLLVGVNPAITATLPTALLLGIALMMARRIR